MRAADMPFLGRNQCLIKYRQTCEAGMSDAQKKLKPGRKPLPEGAGKTARVQLKLTKADKAAWLRKAEAAGLTLQAWVELQCKR